MQALNWIGAHWALVSAALYALLNVLNALLPWPKAQGVLARLHQLLDLVCAFKPNARVDGVKLSVPLLPSSRPADLTIYPKDGEK